MTLLAWMPSISNFNSIKVRLEQSGHSRSCLFHHSFQFHKGTIRTEYFVRFQFVVVKFQFHKGTIRTFLQCCLIYGSITFQFHKGTIRTSTEGIDDINPSNFNSIKVRLERAANLYQPCETEISIP